MSSLIDLLNSATTPEEVAQVEAWIAEATSSEEESVEDAEPVATDSATKKTAKSPQRERTSSAGELAAFAGVNRTTIYEWKKLRGYPIAEDGTVCKWELCEWFLKRSMSGMVAGDEEVLEGTDSPMMERFRGERWLLARLQRRKEEGRLVDRNRMRDFIMRVASLFRGWLDDLQRQHGPEVYKSACDVLGNIEAATKLEFTADEIVDASKLD